MNATNAPLTFISVQMFDTVTNTPLVYFNGRHDRPDELEQLAVESFRCWYRDQVRYPLRDPATASLRVNIQ